MRLPLAKLFDRSDAGNHTEVNGDVNGPVLSGGFQGPVQQVHVIVPPPEVPPEPPSLIRDQIKSMWMMLVEDQRERRLRQLEADRYRATVRMWLICLSIGMLVSVLFWSLVIAQFNSRFGWLW